MPPPAEGLASRLVLGPALRAQPDRRLVTLVRDGYESAFEEIVRRYGKPLTRYAATIVGGRSEDVTQDAFSKALLALRRDDADIELRPWLFRIVRNTALNELRDRPPSPEVLAEAIAGGQNPAEAVERREELADLIRRLQALPEPQRAAIVMRELEGLGHEEIAAALGLSGGGARQAIYRARQTLRDGAGLLVPLPLLKTLLEGSGPGAAEAASAAGAGGVAGAGVALKAATATVLVAGAVGAGVALDHGARPGNAEAIAQPSRNNSAAAATAASSGEASGGEQLVDRSMGHDSPGDDRGEDRHSDRGRDGSSSGPGGGSRSGPGEGSESAGPGLSHTDSSRHGSGSGESESPKADAGDAGSVDRSGPGGGSGPSDESPQIGESTVDDDSGSNAGPGSGGGGGEESPSGGPGGSSGSSDSGGSDGSGSGGGGSSGPGGSGDSSRDSSGGDGLTG
jgi:RNA polymerase sigma factor (sigma-70 family)